MRALYGASSSSSGTSAWAKQASSSPKPQSSKAVGDVHAHYQQVSPRDSVVSASVFAPDATLLDRVPNVEFRIPGSSSSSSKSQSVNEEQSSLSPEAYSWWVEILAQITNVDYLSTVDMSTPRSILRHPETYKRPVQTGLLYLFRALNSWNATKGFFVPMPFFN